MSHVDIAVYRLRHNFLPSLHVGLGEFKVDQRELVAVVDHPPDM